VARLRSARSTTRARSWKKRGKIPLSGTPLQTVRQGKYWTIWRSAVQLDADGRSAVPERRRVFSGAERILIETATSVAPAKPVLIARLAVVDGAARLGEVDIARSLRPALTVAAFVACGSSGLGLLMFLLLRVVPLRMLAAAIEHASFLSAHDLLTGLPNRRLFHDRLEQALAHARREAGRIAVFYMDLDNFKTINDVFGHPAGDATLRTVAERLRKCLRAGDTLARLGGDEFAVIQQGLVHAEDADALGKRMLAAVGPPITSTDNFSMSGSVLALLCRRSVRQTCPMS
jgi:diguanylate cyclase (GGDEF)-like protein